MQKYAIEMGGVSRYFSKVLGSGVDSTLLSLAPFRVCFGPVLGPFRGVGWGQGGVGESGFFKGKEYQ